MDLKKPHVDWLENRGIDHTLAAKFGVETIEMEGRYVLSVPYRENGKTINHKYRSSSEKRFQRMDKDAPLILLNRDCLLDESLTGTPLIIVEGEWDFLATLTAGKRRVVSVPNGAPLRASDDTELQEGSRYEWYWRDQALLDKVDKVILAVDGDEAGQSLAADLCRLFGPARCMFIEYPEHCKDPNEIVQFHGHQRLVEVLDAAKPYPVKGLYQIDDFPEQPAYQNWSTGVAELDELFRIVPRTFTVVTGWAGQGKTSFLMWILAGLIRRGVHVTVASFETDIRPIFHRKLLAALLETGEFAQHDAGHRKWAEDLIRKHVALIAHAPTGDEDALTLEDVLELGRASVIRHGTRMLLIDPWNEIDHFRRRDESETEYVGRSIRAMKRFAKQNDLALWIIAHPSKPQEMSARKIPGLYDISGSANWANKADYGISFQIKNRDYWTTTIACTKVRMGLPGKMGTVVVQYDPRKSRYSFYSGDLEEAA